jgi:hypothetical protein
MNRLVAGLALAMAAASGCKCKRDASTTAATAAADAAAVGGAPTADGPPGKSLPPPPKAEPATHDDCQETGDYARRTLRAVAASRDVPLDGLDAVEADLAAAFIEACKQDRWPAMYLDCIGKNDNDLMTYERCTNRLPAVARAAWTQRLVEIVGKAGGQVEAGVPAPAGTGPTFEELCGGFVDQVARLEECAGPGWYMPAIEQVFHEGRRIAVDGVIPEDHREPLRELCAERAQMVHGVTGDMCMQLLQ